MATTREQIRVSREWLELVKVLPESGRVIVIGPSDSGKSTLCRWILSRLPDTFQTALVDSDTGQSQVGPPGCVGWRLAGESGCSFFFVGDTTAATVPAGALAATVRAVKSAEACGAGMVLLDTSGYLGGRGGFEFKNAKLELLAPAHVIVLGDSPEVRRLLAAWHRDTRVKIHRMVQSDVLQQKSREQRVQWRQERWAEQFAGLDLRRVSLRGKALSGLPTASELKKRDLTFNDLTGLIVCFHDRERRCSSLGLLQSLDLRQQQILVRAAPEAETAAGIMFGLLRVTAEGQELGRII